MVCTLNKEEIISQFKSFSINFPNALALVNEENEILHINKNFENLFGYKMENVIGKDINQLIVPDDYIDEASLFSELVMMGNSIERECIRLTKDNHKINIKVTAFPISNDDKDIGFIGIYEDIRDNNKNKTEIQQANYLDSITNIYNRYFIEEKILKLDQYNNPPIAVIIGDLNGLKTINNEKGFIYGNQLLKNTASILKKSCPSRSLIARWAEDEFIILIPDTNCDKARKIIIKLNKKFTDNKINITFGKAIKNSQEKDIQEVIIKAENRMCMNKLNTHKSSCSKIITSMHKMMTEKSYETEEHIQRLKKYVFKISKLLNYSNYQRNKLLLLSQLHDIGKIAVPNAILNKPGPLKEKEFEIIKNHPEVGYRVANAFNELAPIAEDILSHHERWDGGGYPRGLKQDNIPVLARVIAIIDSYDVMTHKRPYKNIMLPADAKKELQDCAGQQFDPDLVELFLRNNIFD